MTKRIAHIIPTLESDGAAGQLAMLAGSLPTDEFEQHVFALASDGPMSAPLRAAGITVDVLDGRWAADPFTLWKLRKRLADLRPDLVHTWRLDASLLGRLAACWASVPRSVDTRRTSISHTEWLPRAVDRCLARCTDRFVINSTAMREAAIKRGLPVEKITVIPCGVAAVEPDDAARTELLDELGLPAGDRLIGLVGPFASHKHIGELIWYFELIYVLHQDIRLLIIGDGADRWQHERLSRLLGSNDRVCFLGQRDGVPRLLAGLDLVWHGSDRTAQPGAILEAMAAGRPVVTIDTPAHRELITSGESGLLVPMGDRAEFGRATDRLLTDSALARRLGEAARHRVLSEFTVEKMVERHLELYRTLLA